MSNCPNCAEHLEVESEGIEAMAKKKCRRSEIGREREGNQNGEGVVANLKVVFTPRTTQVNNAPLRSLVRALVSALPGNELGSAVTCQARYSNG